MAASQLLANLAVQWVQTRSNAPFAPTKQGLDGLEYNLADLNTIFDFVYANSVRVPPSSYFDLDLKTDLIDLVYEEFSFQSLLFLFILPTTQGVEVGPAPSDGLEIFTDPSGGTTGRFVYVPPNGTLFWGGDPAGTGLTVDATHKVLRFENTGITGDLEFEIVLAGAGETTATDLFGGD